MRLISLTLIGLLCMACSQKAAEQAVNADAEVISLQPRVGSQPFVEPKATVFRMSGDYSDNVGVTLNPDGTLAYFPDPSDITPSSAPIDLGGGWWLNRQGLSSRSVFTKWTFAEYASLERVPSRRQILEAIIPEARVTEMISLPVSLSDALADPSICRQYLPEN